MSIKELLSDTARKNCNKRGREFFISYYNVAGNEVKRFYKGFLLGMLAIAVNGYIVKRELESGYGRLDMIYPKEKRYGKYAAIFEVKRANKENEIEGEAEEAFEQIRERKYYAKIENLGYETIGFGIAFLSART